MHCSPSVSPRWSPASPRPPRPSPPPPGRATLTGFASLPAETFVPNSETSGTQLGPDPVNGLTPPFA
ncbi:hypothetical protein ACFSTC_31660 [Nonomuraea ferruginea]